MASGRRIQWHAWHGWVPRMPREAFAPQEPHAKRFLAGAQLSDTVTSPMRFSEGGLAMVEATSSMCVGKQWAVRPGAPR